MKYPILYPIVLCLMWMTRPAFGYATPTNLVQNPGFEDTYSVLVNGVPTQLPMPWHSNGYGYDGWSIVPAGGVTDKNGYTLSHYTSTGTVNCLRVIKLEANRISSGDNSTIGHAAPYSSGMRAPDGVSRVLFDPGVTYTMSTWLYIPVAYSSKGVVAVDQTIQDVTWAHWFYGSTNVSGTISGVPVGVWTRVTKTLCLAADFPAVTGAYDFHNFHINARWSPAYFDDAAYTANYHYFTGRVVDTSISGNPGVAGLAVRVGNNADVVVDPSAPPSVPGTYVDVTTDADGYYSAFVPDSITTYASCAKPDSTYEIPVPVSMGPASTDVIASDIQLAKRGDLVTISGRITQQGTTTGIGDVVVTATSTEYGASTAATQADGSYSMQVAPGTYMVTVGCHFSWSVPMGASPWTAYTYDEYGFPQDVILDMELILHDVPRAEDLLFSCITDSLPPFGSTGPWATFFPDGGAMAPIGNPMVETIGGVNWEHNVYTQYDGFRLGSYSSPIACNGASIVVAVKPARNTTSAAWTSVVDIFYNRLVLGVRNNSGLVNVARNGAWSNSTAVIADGKRMVLSLVAQSNGTYKVWANGTQIMDITSTSDMTSLVPGVVTGDPILGYDTHIDVGRNDPDGWTTFNGDIGDVYVYKAALSDSEREQLENDIIAKFGISTAVYTIDASAGEGGSISPSGSVSVESDSSKTFTIIPSLGYAIADVLVDSGSVGPVPSYTFSGIDDNHTISATFYLLDTADVSGLLTDQTTGLGIPDATVYFSMAPNASDNAAYRATTDEFGAYNITVPCITWHVCASHATHLTSMDQTVIVDGPVSDVDFALAPSGRDVPRMSDLLFAVVTDSLPADGPTGPWAVFHPLGLSLAPIESPVAEMVDGRKWERNVYRSGVDPDWVYEYDGYRLGAYSSPIPIDGASIVLAVKPIRNGVGTSWTSCVDLMYDRLLVGITNDTGLVCVRRNGSDVALSSAAIPDGQPTILSLVAQPNGTYKVWANGSQIMSSDVTSDMTSLVPGVAGSFADSVNVGRNDPDGWTTFNGDIGDVFVYKVALTDIERGQLEADLSARFCIAPPQDVADIAALKAKPEGSLVRLTGIETVIYAPLNSSAARSTTFFYVGETQGLGGLRVADKVSDSLALGNQVTDLTGYVRKPAGAEPYLELTVDPVGSGGAPIGPLGMNNKTASTDARARTNAVKVWGKVTSVSGGTSFTIDDGYGIGITVMVNGVVLPVGFDTTKTAVVTGVLSEDLNIQAQDIQAF